jgi:hypothetical protein
MAKGEMRRGAERRELSSNARLICRALDFVDNLRQLNLSEVTKLLRQLNQDQ